jgi:very-short-patch-repair endonuclease
VDPVAFVASIGGIASAVDLASAGVGRRKLTVLVAQGTLRRPRLGWYSTLSPTHPRFRAVRIGGRLTGLSALDDMGAWILRRPTGVEVAVARGSARLRRDPGAVVHWVAERGTPSSPAVVGLGEALVRVILDHDLEVSVPCLDWALFTGRLDRIEFERLILALPKSARGIRDWVDPRSQSVLESTARVRLRRAGWTVVTQVGLRELDGWIDMVVGDGVALELDGRTYHQSTFESDRRKDLTITIEGRHSIRVSREMLIHDWKRVELAIVAALRARGIAQHSAISGLEPHGRRHAWRAGRVID